MLAGARRAGRAVHGDVQLVDAGETAGEVAGEQPAQARATPPRRRRRSPPASRASSSRSSRARTSSIEPDVDTTWMPRRTSSAGRLGVGAAAGEHDDRRLDVGADEPVAVAG